MSRKPKEEYCINLCRLEELAEKVEDQQLKADFISAIGDVKDMKTHLDSILVQLVKQTDMLSDILY
jgi:hypothetical protein